MPDKRPDPTAPIHVVMEGLSRSFGDTEVLRAIDFDGEVRSLAIIGPSGGGKSTLLRILGGLLAPTAGRLIMDGEPVDFAGDGLLAYRRHLGFVFQDGGLFHHMTALENIAVPLHVVHGLDEKAAGEKARELLARFGLEKAAERHPAELSGGQRQRVAIARAIAPEPQLLLLDEPTSALDPEYTTEVLDMVRDLKEGGTRFIIVTHEMGFARKACDDVAFLYDGGLLEHGPSAEVFAHPQSPELRRFLGRILEWSL